MNESKKPKLLVISQALPPEVSASSVLVYNIFSHYRGNMEAIGRVMNTKTDPLFQPCWKSYYITPPSSNKYFYYLFYRFSLRFRFIHKMMIKKLVKKIRPDVIMGNYPDAEFFILSFEIARELNIPFYAYFHDLWEENVEGYHLKLAKKYEPQMIAYSKRVIACTEFQKKFLDDKYGISSEILYHPVPDEEIVKRELIINQSDIKKIVFLGSVSTLMNLDALKVASNAITKLPPAYQFVLLPIQYLPLPYLKSKGLNTKRIKVEVVSRGELGNALQEADILLAPLSFKNGSADEIKTVFSNKILKYLVSGKPILVFGPADSYHSVSARKYGWGYVVDEDREDALNNGILSLMNDPDLQASLVAKAFEEADKRRAGREADKILNWVNEDYQH